MKSLIPSELLAAFAHNRDRISAAQVAAIIEAIIDGDFGITESSAPYGNQFDGFWIIINAGGYRLWFYYKEGFITNCFGCLTPKNKEYRADKDGEVVSTYFSRDEWIKLDTLVKEHRATVKRKVAIKQCWVVIIDAGTDHWSRVGPQLDKGPGKKGITFPSELSFGVLYEEAAAELARDKFIEYQADLESKPEKKKK